MKNKLKQKKLILKIIVLINIILSILLLIFPIKIESSKTNVETNNLIPAEKIKKGNLYSQKFVSNISYLNSIGIRFSTYSIINTEGSISVIIQDEKNNIIYKDIVSLVDLKDNEVYYFEFEEIKNSNGKNYTISFEYDDYKKDNSLTYWYSNENISNNFEINSVKTDSEMYLCLKGKSNDYFMAWYPLFVACLSYMIITVIEGDENDK